MRNHAIAIVAAGLMAAACTPAPRPGPVAERPGGGPCDAAAVQRYVGERATTELGARILAESGARQLRWGPPDSAMTMDYREDRLNIFYDRQMIIGRITCG